MADVTPNRTFEVLKVAHAHAAAASGSTPNRTFEVLKEATDARYDRNISDS